MEDPIRFNLWVKVVPGNAAKAVAWLMTQRPDLTELAARKAVNDSAVRGSWVLSAQHLGWKVVGELVKALPDWCAENAIYQEGDEPADNRCYPIKYCPFHKLFYSGTCGCYVCTGFYVR